MRLRLHAQNIFAFSDTHGAHRALQVPEDADIVICAGDAVEDNLLGGEYDNFIEWFAAQPGKWKIFVPGNHELSFDLDQAEEIIKQFEEAGITILQDAIEDFGGISICSISGNARIADEDIPEGIDILVTHYPPFGILDEDLGSPEILNFVLKAKPKSHFFGHIHATEGQSFQLGDTTCQNISVFHQLS